MHTYIERVPRCGRCHEPAWSRMRCRKCRRLCCGLCLRGTVTPFCRDCEPRQESY